MKWVTEVACVRMFSPLRSNGWDHPWLFEKIQWLIERNGEEWVYSYLCTNKFSWRIIKLDGRKGPPFYFAFLLVGPCLSVLWLAVFDWFDQTKLINTLLKTQWFLFPFSLVFFFLFLTYNPCWFSTVDLKLPLKVFTMSKVGY